MKSMIRHIVVVVIVAVFCSVQLSGQDFMYWEDDFEPIILDNLTARDGISEGEAQVKLFTSGDAEISADNSTAARLDGPSGDYLITKYRLNFDGDGVTETGASDTEMTDYDQFLVPPVQITHVADDNDVQVTLRVRARPRNAAGDLADAGTYTATQTLTVHWVGP